MDISNLSVEQKQELFNTLYHDLGVNAEEPTELEPNAENPENSEKPVKATNKPRVKAETKIDKLSADGTLQLVFEDYEGGLSQVKIAEKRGISKFMVSKLIKLGLEKANKNKCDT
jgi:DNA-directed RNA polymerase specialized sigma24 family protein